MLQISSKLGNIMTMKLTILFFLLGFTNALSQNLIIRDGDTIKLNGETIRFSGIDTPETIYYQKYIQLCYFKGKKIMCGELSKKKINRKNK